MKQKEAIFTKKAKHYFVCFADQCPLHETCLRWEVGQYVDADEVAIMSMNPRNRKIAQAARLPRASVTAIVRTRSSECPLVCVNTSIMTCLTIRSSPSKVHSSTTMAVTSITNTIAPSVPYLPMSCRLSRPSANVTAGRSPSNSTPKSRIICGNPLIL